MERSRVACDERSPCDEVEVGGNLADKQDQGARNVGEDTRRLLVKVEHEQHFGSLVAVVSS